ncbi:MAG: hypothetical protein HUU15_20275, partial [Candidatus Brocadiae bacterium]|nr:hypothetical protein [Candidatus Brocadiia bacterium]
GAAAGLATAAWGAAICLVPVRGLGAILLPLPAIWSARAACEGLAAARLYGKPLLVAVLLAVVAGGASLLVAFVALCSVESGYGRIVDAFKG